MELKVQRARKTGGEFILLRATHIQDVMKQYLSTHKSSQGFADNAAVYNHRASLASAVIVTWVARETQF